MATAGTPYASASLYIGDLTPDVTEALLFEIFNAVGPVASVRVCRDAATRRSLGYAYVNFHRVDDAERALDTMNFKSIRNRPCRIMWSHRDPSLRKSGVGNIFVKNLAKSIDNKSLFDTFSMFGNILSCKVSTNAKGESLGYGFVHYESEEAAANAINRVDGKLITGEKVEVSAFKSRKERGGNKFRFTNVYVKNLPLEFTQKDLENLFSKYGDITSSMLPAPQTGEDGTEKSKGFGFINFNSPEAAAAAVEGLNGFEIAPEKKLYVVRAQKKEEREKELRERFELLKIERQKKYAGVNLYVKNLGDDVEDERLKEEFAKFGTITSAHIMKENGKSKGFGFVCFATPEEATKALTMNGRMLNQKPLYVALAQRKEVRRAALEAQYAQRQKVGMPMPQPHVFPGGMPQQVPGGPAPGPMFYQGVPQRNFAVYPQQMMARQWNMTQPNGQATQGGAMQMRPPHPSLGYQLMPMGNRPGRGGRGGGQNRPTGGRQPQQAKQAQQTQGPPQVANPSAPLTAKALAEANEEQKKQMIGERLFPLIKAQRPTLAGKITGMLLEMDNTELLHLLESPQALGEKIQEALAVLDEHGQGVTETSD